MIRTFVVLAFLAAFALIGGITESVTAQDTPATVDIPANLAPENAVLLFELDASGVQIYTCEADPDDASSFVWTFRAPEAELFNTRGEMVGIHVAGPTWQGLDGSAVVAEVVERADSPETGAIPWLLLQVREQSGFGVFSTVTNIQRLNTVGGVAPTEGCDEDHAGEEARVPYEATYAFFYPTTPPASDPNAPDPLPTSTPPPTASPVS